MANTNEPTKESKETIVIAEDSLPNQKILQHLLLKLGYEVIACNNGQEAWNRLSHPNTKNVVAILSDMMMPELDGMSLLKKVRTSEAYKSLPFVLVTAVADKDNIKNARDLQVNGYILKPVTFQRITAKLKELFPQKKFPNLAA
jgi:two-component system chemotaxis response regulator CheY